MGFLSSIGAKVIAGGALLFAVVLAVLRFFGRAKQAGRDAAARKHLEDWHATQRKVDQATGAVERLDDDAVREQLRRRAAAVTGDPVQRGDAAARGKRP